MPTSSPTTLDDPATGQAEVPIRSRSERELARLLLAKARWKRQVTRLQARPSGPDHPGARDSGRRLATLPRHPSRSTLNLGRFRPGISAATFETVVRRRIIQPANPGLSHRRFKHFGLRSQGLQVDRPYRTIDWHDAFTQHRLIFGDRRVTRTVSGPTVSVGALDHRSRDR